MAQDENLYSRIQDNVDDWTTNKMQENAEFLRYLRENRLYRRK